MSDTPPAPRAVQLKLGNRLHPDLLTHLDAAVLCALDRAGLRRLYTTLTVFLQGNAAALVALDALDMGLMWQPLEQSRLPPEQIGQILGWVMLYLKARFEIPIALPDLVSEHVISALSELDDLQPLTEDMCRRVDERLGAAAKLSPTEEPVAPPPEPPPPPPADVQQAAPQDNRPRAHGGLLVRLTAACGEALARVGLERLHGVMGVCIQSSAAELVLGETLELMPLWRALEQNQVPPEQIGQVLGWILLYARKEMALQVALPDTISDKVVDALVEMPPEEAVLPGFSQRVHERLQEAALQVVRPAWRFREVQGEKKQTKKKGRYSLENILAVTAFVGTVGYWGYFGFQEYNRPVLDPRVKVVWLDPKAFSKVTEVLKARVSNGTLFVTVPDKFIPTLGQQEQRVLAERLLSVVGRKDIRSVTLRDSETQADIHLPK